MLLVEDNFLSVSELEHHRINLLAKIDLVTLRSCEMWQQSYEFQSGDIEEIRSKLGIVWAITCKKIQQFLSDNLQISVSPYSLRYQCMTDSYTIHPHKDGCIREKTIDKCYTTIVYLNDEWDETLGGNFETAGNSVVSLPNRLVVYSREEEHWVSPALTKWNLPRQMLLVSWSKSDEN